MGMLEHCMSDLLGPDSCKTKTYAIVRNIAPGDLLLPRRPIMIVQPGSNGCREKLPKGTLDLDPIGSTLLIASL